MLVDLSYAVPGPAISYRGFEVQPEDISNLLLGVLSSSFSPAELSSIIKRIPNASQLGLSSTSVVSGRIRQLLEAYAIAVDKAYIPIYNPAISDRDESGNRTGNYKVINYLVNAGGPGGLSTGFSYSVIKAIMQGFGNAVIAGEIDQYKLTRQTVSQSESFVQTVQALPGLRIEQANQIIEEARKKKPNIAAAFLLPAAAGIAAGLLL